MAAAGETLFWAVQVLHLSVTFTLLTSKFVFG